MTRTFLSLNYQLWGIKLKVICFALNSISSSPMRDIFRNCLLCSNNIDKVKNEISRFSYFLGGGCTVDLPITMSAKPYFTGRDLCQIMLLKRQQKETNLRYN